MWRRLTVAAAAVFTLVLPAPASGATPTGAASSVAALADPSGPGAHAAGYVDTTVNAAGRSFFSARIYYRC